MSTIDEKNAAFLATIERPEGCTCELEYETTWEGAIHRAIWSGRWNCPGHSPKTAAQIERLNKPSNDSLRRAYGC